jgi:hypothetical protein
MKRVSVLDSNAVRSGTLFRTRGDMVRNTLRSGCGRLWFSGSLLVGLLCKSGLAIEIPSIQWRGFLTAGYAQTLSDDTYLSFIGSNPNFLYDTIAGLGFSSSPTKQIEVGGQLVAHGALQTFTPSMDWAFVTYRPTDSFSLQAGKLRFPMWLISDYYFVGYSYPWVRPPPEVYSLDLLSSYFGASGRYQFELSGGTVALSLFGGSSPFNVPIASQGLSPGKTRIFRLQGSFDNLIGTSLSYDSLKFRARISFANMRANLSYTGDLDVLPGTTFAPDVILYTQNRVRLPIEGQYNFWSAGIDWSAMSYLRLMVEYLGAKFSRNMTSHNGYATLSMPLGWIEPNLTFARAGTHHPSYHRYALGAGFPIAQGASLKVQWGLVDVKSGNGPILVAPGHIVHIVSANFNLLF